MDSGSSETEGIFETKGAYTGGTGFIWTVKEPKLLALKISEGHK